MRVRFNKCFAEFICTFALVFAGTGAIVINDVSGGRITNVGISSTFGLSVLAMIYTLGDISGAHLNPAATSAFWVSVRFLGQQVIAYVLAQCLGGITVSVILHFLYPTHATLATTLPVDLDMQSFVLELILTLILMFVILNISTGAKEKGVTAGIAVVIGLEAMFAGPICGASMNPARSLAPALMSGQWEHIWIYLTAPVFGACLAVFACRACQDSAFCPITSKSK